MIHQPITDPAVEALYTRLPEDRVDSFLLANGAYRGALLHGTRMVNDARSNHDLGLIETLLLGHAYLAGGLLSTNVKGNDRISVEISCDGPVAGLFVEATAAGTVRGYLKQNPIPLETEPTSLDPRQFFGAGTLAVTKTLERSRQPFTGRIAMQYGSLAQDLAAYFTVSEQTPSAVHLSIQFDSDGRAVGAGGMLIQALPQIGQYEDRETALDTIDEAIAKIGSIGALFVEGWTPRRILDEHFASLEPILLAEKPTRFHCPCTRERFLSFISALSLDELNDIRSNGPFPLRTTCHNCNTTYEFSRDEIEEAYQMAR